MLSIPLILTGTAFATLPLSTSEWLPLLQTDGPMADDLEPTASLGHVDIVGDGSHPSGEWSMDASTVYVRMRLSSSPADLSPIPFDCGFLQCQWGVLIDTDDDLSNFERALVLTDGAASIQLRTDTVGIGPLAETEAVLFDETDPMGSAMVRASEAWSSSTGATHAFLEFAVPRVWLNLSTATATVRVTLATGFGIPGDGFSVDLSSSDSLESLEGAWSIPIGLDGDGDELMLSEELELGSDPQDADTDDDGLDDREERDLGTSPILSDTDADELSDWDEVETYGTNPVMADTDGDGITDGDEVILFGTDPLDSLDPDPSLDADCDGISDEIDSAIDGETDADGDGLSNEAEWECGSDPCVANSDIDDDGISNVDELLYGTNPCDGEDPDPNIDDDCDGIPDYADTSIEFANNDVDSDGILNEDEASCGTDPCTAEEDHDADGISTQDEIDRYGTDPCDIGDPDASIDEDCDGIPDYADELVNFDPLADNDGDHIPNGHELDVCQSDPCTPNPDRDRDGVSNEIETTCGTDPCSPDSDADGLWDGVELTDEECTDSDNDGTIDALDPNAPVSPDPTRPEAGNFGLSGGSFTGGGCSNAPHSPVPWLAGFAALLLLGRRTESATVLLMAGALHSTHARAQSIDADRFRPASTNSAFAGLMDVTDSATEWTGSAWFHYANSPLMYRYTDPESNPIYLVRSLWTMTPQIEYRHVDWLASASMPVHVLAASDDEGQWFEAGDTRISVGHVFADRNRRPIGMALTSTLTLPTGNQGAWLGRSSTRAGTMGHFTVGRNALLAAAIGFEAGSKEDLPGITIGSDLLWNVGASLPIATQHRVSTEIDSNHGLNNLFTTGSSPIEASAHWHWALAPNWVASVGGATALTQGIGAPKYRVVAGIRRTPLPAIAPPKSLDPAPTKVNKAPVEMSPAPAIDRVVHIAVTNAKGQPLVARIHSTEPSSDDLGATNPDGLATLSLSMDASAIRIHAADHAPTIHEFGTNAPATVQLAVQLAPARVHIGASQLRIDDKIFFESGAALIEPESHSLLNEIALVLLDNPTLAHVQIHGHTDSRGSDADNRELSMQRATAVMDFLIRVGINPDRLSAHGFGESKPIDPSPTPQAHATNRRVEFHITDAP